VRVVGVPPRETREFRVDPRVTLEVEVLAGAGATVLEPLVVTGTRRADRRVEAFYQRAARRRTTGTGLFLTRADLERSGTQSLATVLDRVPELRVVDVVAGETAVPQMELRMVARGRTCSPRFYVDGVAFPIGSVNPSLLRTPAELEGVEVYDSPVEAPPEFQDPNGCGTVLLWTRTDGRAGRRSSWKRNLLGGSVLLALLLPFVLD